MPITLKAENRSIIKSVFRTSCECTRKFDKLFLRVFDTGAQWFMLKYCSHRERVDGRLFIANLGNWRLVASNQLMERHAKENHTRITKIFLNTNVICENALQMFTII